MMSRQVHTRASLGEGDDSPRSVALDSYVEVGVLGEGDLQERRVGRVAQQMLGDVPPIQSAFHLQPAQNIAS